MFAFVVQGGSRKSDGLVRRVAPSGSLENFAAHRCLEATTVPQENVWNLAPQQPRGGERYLLLCLCFCLLNKLRFTDATQQVLFNSQFQEPLQGASRWRVDDDDDA